MTFSTFNWLNEQLSIESNKVNLTLEVTQLVREPGQEYKLTVVETFSSSDDIKYIDETIKAHLARYKKGYYNFLLICPNTARSLLIFDGDAYNEENGV